MFLGIIPSTMTVWFSDTIVVDSLCKKSFLEIHLLLITEGVFLLREFGKKSRLEKNKN